MANIDDQPSTILIYVGLDRVGDSLLKLPFVRALRKAWPKARIAWAAGKETSVYAGVMAPLVQGLLDEVIENANIGKSPSDLLRRPLKGRAFDLVIDTQRILWISLCLWRIPSKAFISPAARFLLSSRKPPRNYQFPKSMQRQLLDLLELASGKTFASPAGLDLSLDAEMTADAARILPNGPVYIGIAPGSGGLPKCWPLENFIAVAQKQAAAGRIPVFILGPKETSWMDQLRQAAPQALFPLQAPGIEEKYLFSPLFTIALSKSFAASVANDSGAGHMFAVGGKPLISLFGRTVAEKFMPMSQKLTIIKAQDFGGRELCFIPVEPVLKAIDQALACG